MINIFFFN